MTAVYARQSVDRVDSISIESQIEFCRHEARGEPFEAYIDRGYSGKNTDRPGFGRMMADLEAGRIHRVIVYKLDRISRSILDFSEMMECFERRGVEFVSTTERFDTSSPMGRAMLNICIVFAQLERETIQKRVADAYYSRSRKSFYMGGRVPYGFRLEPTVIGGVKTSRYVPQPEEAEQIRLIYELYAAPETSYGDILRVFQERGHTKGVKPWSRARLADTLRNPVYVRADLRVYAFFQEQGAVVVNDPADFIGVGGCYCYKGPDASGRKRRDPKGSHLVLAPHEGIVDAGVWLRCREKCLATRQVGPSQKAKNTWLAGLIKCGRCGYALVDKRYRDRNTRYLFCSGRMNSGLCEGAGTLHTDELEQLVREQIQRKLALFPVLGQTREEPASPERRALRLEQLQARREIGGLLARLAEADDVLFRHINRRVEELEARAQELETRLEALERGGDTSSQTIRNHLTDWDTLAFGEKRRVAGLLIRVIHASQDSIRIDWRI